MSLPEVLDFPPSTSPPPPPSPSPFPQCDYSEWSPSLVFIPSVYVLVFVLGSLGNGLVLWVYLDRHGRGAARAGGCLKAGERKGSEGGPPGPAQSRSITDALIASLAAADMAFVLTLPLWAAYTALGYHWPFGKPLCQLTSYVVTLNMYASVFSLTGLSVERYWVIARRRTRGGGARGAGPCRAPVVVGGVWLVAGALALPALLLRTVKRVSLQADDEWSEEEGDAGMRAQDYSRGAPAFISSCDMDYSGLIPDQLEAEERERLEVVWEAALGLKATLLGFLLPLAVLLLCYCSLARLLARHFRRGPRPDRPRQRRLLRVIVTLVLAFFLCWLPYHANKSLAMLMELELLPYSCPFDQLLVGAHPYTICLGYVNSCLNPLLYACCDTAFRRRCRALLKNTWCAAGRGGASEAEEEQEEEEEEEGEASGSSDVPSAAHAEAGDSQGSSTGRECSGHLRGVGNGASDPCGMA